MNIKNHIIAILAFVCCFAFCSCTLRKEESSQKLYHIGMFDSLSVNESTLHDVAAIVPDATLFVTSFGGVIELPAENEKYIQIKIVGSEMIVDSIELVNTPWCDK